MQVGMLFALYCVSSAYPSERMLRGVPRAGRWNPTMSGQRWVQLGNRLTAWACLCVSFLPAVTVANDTTNRGVRPFTRDALMERFDKNRDGKLDSAERVALRKAFGGIDVPMLPTQPYDYTTAEYPPHIDREEIDRIDNMPNDNPTTDAGAALGRVLFHDRLLSRNRTISCASCHLQRTGFSDPRRFSVGFEGERTGRNAMSLAGLRYSNLKGNRPGFFWDERAVTLEAQVLMPIQDGVEMGMSLGELEKRLQRAAYYPPLFESAFGSSRVTSDRLAKAVAQFLRSLNSFGSRFDRAAAKATRRGDYALPFDLFTAQENLGKSLFIKGLGDVSELGCAVCHVPPTFGMAKSMNNGLELAYKDRGLGGLDHPVNDPFTPSNDGKFKAPSLRNVELTAPYMHDGRFDTLEEVIDHYSEGVHPHKNLALAFEARSAGKATSGFGYGAAQKAALIAFLKTLTDEAFVSDPKFADPFVRLEP